MNKLLLQDKQAMQRLLEQTSKAAATIVSKQESLSPGRFVNSIAMENLADKGIGAEEVLKFFTKYYADQMLNSTGPRYFGFVVGGSTPAAVMGDWLVTILDQNTIGSNDSIAPQIEHQTIHFLKQLFGLDKDFFGSFVTGATMSNFTSLAIARQWVGEQHGLDISNEGLTNGPSVKVLSATPHSSIVKSLSMLGIGRKSVIGIKTLPDREAVDISDLEQHLQKTKEPVIVVANAGTVNTVDFDDLEAIGTLKEKYNFWMHVDAAFGGFAACTPKYASYVKGINRADSVTIDAHKWLNVPYDSAMQFTRHRKLQEKVFQNKAPYLGKDEMSLDLLHYTPENSRRFRALPAWFTLMAYGKEGYREIVERNCRLAYQLGERIRGSDKFRLLAPVRMNVVCFTLKQEELSMEAIQDFLNKVRDDGRTFLTPTLYKGVPAIRAAVSNWQTTEKDIEITFQALDELCVISENRKAII